MNERDEPTSGIRVPDALDGHELLVASNREPYAHGYDEDGEIMVSRPAGGLTAALDPIMQEQIGRAHV